MGYDRWVVTGTWKRDCAVLRVPVLAGMQDMLVDMSERLCSGMCSSMMTWRCSKVDGTAKEKTGTGE